MDDARLRPDLPPLVVDVDGTLIRTDLLAESWLLLLRAHPWRALASPFYLLRGRAAFKRQIAAFATPEWETLPYDPDMLALVQGARAEGREVYLASASDAGQVESLARTLGLFEGVFASDGAVNLRGEAKAGALAGAFGEAGFDYAGNSRHDLPVWRRARGVFVVGARTWLRRRTQRDFPQARVLGYRAKFADYARALRPRRWPKNLLILAPLAAAHLLTRHSLPAACLAFVSFSLAASSAYVLHDLLHLPDDRRNPIRRAGALASGALPPPDGLVLVLLLLTAALGLCALLPLSFLYALLAYSGLALLYSLYLVRAPMLGALVLAALYGTRIAAGIALGAPVTGWLILFSLFLFLSLGLLRRSAQSLEQVGIAPADTNPAVDADALQSLAAGSGFAAVLVLALYVLSPEAADQYRHPAWLWVACLALVYWLGRLQILIRRGELRGDPLSFAVTDRPSLFCMLLFALLIYAGA